MFVNIVKNGSSSIYECNNVHITNMAHKDKEEVKEQIELRLEHDNSRNINIVVDKDSKTQIYLMNNEGQTIDKYAWSDPK